MSDEKFMTVAVPVRLRVREINTPDGVKLVAENLKLDTIAGYVSEHYGTGDEELDAVDDSVVGYVDSVAFEQESDAWIVQMLNLG